MYKYYNQHNCHEMAVLYEQEQMCAVILIKVYNEIETY